MGLLTTSIYAFKYFMHCKVWHNKNLCLCDQRLTRIIRIDKSHTFVALQYLPPPSHKALAKIPFWVTKNTFKYTLKDKNGKLKGQLQDTKLNSRHQH